MNNSTANNKKDSYIKVMADLLRKGATMLDLSCPACDNILFRLQDGTIYCPVCKKKVIIKKEEDLNTENPIDTSNKINESNTKIYKINNFGQWMNKILLNKLESISNKLNETNDLFEIQNYLKIINNLYDLIEKTKKIFEEEE